MAKQKIFCDQKFWVVRDEDGILYLYSNDYNPANLSDTPFVYRFFEEGEDFLPFIKSGEKPSLCAFRAVDFYNFNIRVNVERGVATRDRYGVLVFKSVSYAKKENLMIYDAKLLPVVTEGTLYNIEIRKLR